MRTTGPGSPGLRVPPLFKLHDPEKTDHDGSPEPEGAVQALVALRDEPSDPEGRS